VTRQLDTSLPTNKVFPPNLKPYPKGDGTTRFLDLLDLAWLIIETKNGGTGSPRSTWQDSKRRIKRACASTSRRKIRTLSCSPKPKSRRNLTRRMLSTSNKNTRFGCTAIVAVFSFLYWRRSNSHGMAIETMSRTGTPPKGGCALPIGEVTRRNLVSPCCGYWTTSTVSMILSFIMQYRYWGGSVA
jgi:hypothetical protein